MLVGDIPDLTVEQVRADYEAEEREAQEEFEDDLD